MNAQSSRSHAIFTLHIKQQRIVKAEVCENLYEIRGAHKIKTGTCLAKVEGQLLYKGVHKLHYVMNSCLYIHWILDFK